MIRRRTPLFLAAVLAAVALFAGCGGSEAAVPTSTVETADAGASMLPNSGISIAEARSLAGDPVAVRAFVFVAPDGTARLCDEVRESFPPQCGQTAIVVTGLPTELIDGLDQAQGVRWSNGPVQLIGTIRDGIFVNDPVALAAS